MLPKWHILSGAILSLFIYLFFNAPLNSLIVLLASVFIDADHYLFYVEKMKDWNLKNSYIWHKKLPKHHKPIMHIFHTLEFLFLVFILVYFWQGFFFVLVGMLFHSIMDVLEMIYNNKINNDN